jgi:hypothetical protein
LVQPCPKVVARLSQLVSLADNLLQTLFVLANERSAPWPATAVEVLGDNAPADR